MQAEPSPRASQKWIALGVVLTAGTLFALIYRSEISSGLGSWLRGRAVDYYLRTVQPRLPFQIEQIEADAPFSDLLQGRIKKLRLVVRRGKLRASLHGPIDIQRPTSARPTFIIQYDAQTTFEMLGRPKSGVSSPFALKLFLETSQGLDQIRELSLRARANEPDWSWPAEGLTGRSIEADASFRGERADANISFARMERADPTGGVDLALTQVALHLNAGLKLSPLVLGPEVSLKTTGRRFQASWQSHRIDLPLSELPVEISGQIQDLRPEKLDIRVGRAQLNLGNGTLSWTTPELSLRELVTQAERAGLLKPVEFSILGGRARSNGALELGELTRLADFGSRSSLGSARLPRGKATLYIKDGAVALPGLRAAARGIDAEIGLSSPREIQADVQAREVYFRKARGKLGETHVRIERGGKFEVTAMGGGPPRLEVDGIDVQVGAIHGTLGPTWDIETSLKLASTPLEKIAHPLCLKGHDRYPPALIDADFSSISISPGTIEPEGQATAHLFGGSVRVDDLGFFDLGTGAPEIDFNLDYDGIRLDQLCDWSGFGEVSGLLQGYAHDVTFQGWLPTHFDLSIDATPMPHATTIGMDPLAMYNLVSLFAGDALSHVPIVAHDGVFNRIFDPYFGWLSKRIGGFDLRYLGLSLFSDSGTILLETHDPPGIYERLKKHYIFWGHRFSMPVQSPHYPVVMDETGMARIFQYMVKRAQLIAKIKRENGGSNGQTTEPIEDDDKTCRPPDF